jgi:hypothetical protein
MGDGGVPHPGPEELDADDGGCVPAAVPVGDGVADAEAAELDAAVADGAVAPGEDEAWPPAGTEVDAVAHPARLAATAATRRSRARMPLRRIARQSGCERSLAARGLVAGTVAGAR